MKLFKNNIKVFVAVVISGIVFTGIGVYAASQYFAKDINFTPINENFKKGNGEPIDNVEDAINELYIKQNNQNNTKFVFEAKAGESRINNYDPDLYIKNSNYELVAKKNSKIGIVCSANDNISFYINNSQIFRTTSSTNFDYSVITNIYAGDILKASADYDVALGFCTIIELNY